ncbi:MAG: 50S ribosomal protein L28 [Alphaproteobacteria bacterium]|nr:50S ribosomal protein L28 [Alphaproteobacteria bacterium]
MSRRCAISGKAVLYGNNVSHANNKSRRRFLPNLQETSFMSEALGRLVRLRLSTNAIRTVEFHGGIDAYLTTSSSLKLTPELVRLKKIIQRLTKASDAAA